MAQAAGIQRLHVPRACDSGGVMVRWRLVAAVRVQTTGKAEIRRASHVGERDSLGRRVDGDQDQEQQNATDSHHSADEF
jgi:hypothetical protein